MSLFDQMDFLSLPNAVSAKAILLSISFVVSKLLNNINAYILVKEEIHLLADTLNEYDEPEENVAFKNNASFIFEIMTQPNNNNLDYLIDPTLRNINRSFLLSLKNDNDDPTRNSFEEYYMSLVEIKDFNALIDNKPFFDQPVKSKQEAYEKLIKISRNDDSTTGNLLDCFYIRTIINLLV